MQSKEALYYQHVNGNVRCLLCPHNCLIREGKTGICHVRRNENGKLFSDIYGKLSAINFDPIEKKPLYHFYPGSVILSIGSVGCNMHCKCCQNWQISQTSADDFPFRNQYSINDIVTLAGSRERNIGVAYTYNEPSIGFEYVLDVARQIKHVGMKNVMVSNGFIAQEPLDDLISCVDAFNIDLKAFSDSFYRKITGARLEPVLATLKRIKMSGRHLEITNLVIPSQNDNEEEFLAMVRWIAGELGNETVLHLSRYHPMFKMNNDVTPAETLLQLAEIAGKYLSYVYIGNIEVRDFQHTRCAKCGKTVIKRTGYQTDIKALDEKGYCVHCKNKIIIL